MMPTLKYLWLTIRHKSFVFRAGLRTKAPIWRLIIHDWSKFTRAEAPHYGRQFFGDKSDPLGFSYAWLHHQRNNPHHWEYWVSVHSHSSERNSSHGLSSLPMPEWAVREMVADWLGAARAYEGEWPDNLEEWGWINDNLAAIKIIMHPDTVKIVDKVLSEVFSQSTD